MPDVKPTASPIIELKVSGHLMALDPGVYCVFNSPGGTAPDAASGLPGVRISPAPAPAGFAGVVSLSGFTADGWIGGADGATLIRVTGAAAQVLVTVYQATDGAYEAPKLQVLRLTDAAPASAPPQAAAPAPPTEVAAHIYGRGDVGGRLGEWMGDRGSKRWIEGFGLAPGGDIPPADIEYQAVLGRGWLSPWAEGGQFCGSRGMSLPILGLRVRLRGPSADTHVASVSATFVDGAAAGPLTGGEACESPSLAALEAFQVTFTRRAVAQKAGPAPKKPGKPGRAKAAPANADPKPAAMAAKPPPPPPRRTPGTTRRR